MSNNIFPDAGGDRFQVPQCIAQRAPPQPDRPPPPLPGGARGRQKEGPHPPPYERRAEPSSRTGASAKEQAPSAKEQAPRSKHQGASAKEQAPRSKRQGANTKTLLPNAQHCLPRHCSHISPLLTHIPHPDHVLAVRRRLHHPQQGSRQPRARPRGPGH